MVFIFPVAYRVLADFFPNCKVRGAINLFSSKDLHSAAQSSVAGGFTSFRRRWLQFVCFMVMFTENKAVLLHPWVRGGGFVLDQEACCGAQTAQADYSKSVFNFIVSLITLEKKGTLFNSNVLQF